MPWDELAELAGDDDDEKQVLARLRQKKQAQVAKAEAEKAHAAADAKAEADMAAKDAKDKLEASKVAEGKDKRPMADDAEGAKQENQQYYEGLLEHMVSLGIEITDEKRKLIDKQFHPKRHKPGSGATAAATGAAADGAAMHVG